MPRSAKKSIVRANSLRELARALGVTHQALMKAQRSGRISSEEDGTWDVEKVRLALIATSAPGSKSEELAAQSSGDTARMYLEVRMLHERLKALERQIRIDEKMRKLIDRDKAIKAVQQLAQEERDALLTFPVRYAATIAAKLSCDPYKLQQELERAIRTHLEERTHATRVKI